MNEKLLPILLVVILTVASGIGDSLGFSHAAAMWNQGRLDWNEFAKSAAGFALGIGTYWLVVRFLNQLDINAPEIQTLLWFGVTLLGVALLNGNFFRWQLLDQLVAVGVLAGIGWLLFRTGG